MYYQNYPTNGYQNGMGMNSANMYAMNGGFTGVNMNSFSPNHFYFTGNALSLQSRILSMTDQQINMLLDATITVTGAEIQAVNNCGLLCTIIWGSIIILPLFFMCCDWWKRCVYPAFQIPMSTYQSLGRLFSSPSIKNITLNIVDNKFDAAKAQTICQMVSQSKINGFTFINVAGNWDYDNNQNSRFAQNMRPIKQMQNVSSDIRWGTQIA